MKEMAKINCWLSTARRPRYDKRMTNVLQNQLEASERSASELVNRVVGHDSNACYDVEDQMRSLVGIFASLSRVMDRWQNPPSTGVSRLDSGKSRDEELERIGQFHRLDLLFSLTARLLSSLENPAVPPEVKREFDAAWRELRGITSFSVEQVAAGTKQIQNGEVRPLALVMNELSDRIVD